ncbi:MAG: hypothetical protein GY950_02540 [bacterium]|nr:hypothetical protein [bacterium]
MRRFSSYGPIDTDLHYYAPRKKLIEKAYDQLVGENSQKGGHYITVWAPRQCGKTWIMQEAVEKIKQTGEYEAGIISMERAKEKKDEKKVLDILIEKLQNTFEKSFPPIKEIDEIPLLFTKQYFRKPVILILDEFDALDEVLINRFAGVFRDLFLSRSNEKDRKSKDKTCLLHGLALVGVRSVLGIENVTGSPFNVQRNLHIPNLTEDEVNGIFTRYEKESGQNVENRVIEQVFYETRGQPGLTCWFGELLTETYNEKQDTPITMENFEEAHAAAVKILPNNNILNIISKANKEPHKQTVLELFETDRKMEFSYDNTTLNYLYLNGVIDREKVGRTDYYVKFACPFIQKRLFNYFAGEYFSQMGQLVEPFAKIDHIVTPDNLDIRGLMKLYEKYIAKNKSWLFKNAPRRYDLRIYEAVFHFSLYAYLHEFLRNKNGRVFPEFPTGNGKIDLLVNYNDIRYGIELKSFSDQTAYRQALEQAARYGKQLRLPEIFLVTFVESIDEENRNTYEKEYRDPATDVTVKPVFVRTGAV